MKAFTITVDVHSATSLEDVVTISRGITPSFISHQGKEKCGVSLGEKKIKGGKTTIRPFFQINGEDMMKFLKEEGTITNIAISEPTEYGWRFGAAVSERLDHDKSAAVIFLNPASAEVQCRFSDVKNLKEHKILMEGYIEDIDEEFSCPSILIAFVDEGFAFKYRKPSVNKCSVLMELKFSFTGKEIKILSHAELKPMQKAYRDKGSENFWRPFQSLMGNR